MTSAGLYINVVHWVSVGGSNPEGCVKSFQV